VSIEPGNHPTSGLRFEGRLAANGQEPAMHHRAVAPSPFIALRRVRQ
jgi:hypothetical protein